MATATASTATKPLTPLQSLILKKLKTYKTAKTSRQIFESLSKTNAAAGKLRSVQQIAASLRWLEDSGLVRADYGVKGSLEWIITSKGIKRLAK